MNKKIYYNAPCGLFHGFLDEKSRITVLNRVLDYCCFVEYNKHNEIKDEEKRFQKVRDTLIFKNGIRESSIKQGEELWLLHVKEPFFSIYNDVFWDFHDNYKSDEECVMLMAYLALKSICGQKHWAKTNKAMWLSRMDGKRRPQYKMVEDKLELDVSDNLAKYKSKYGIRRLRALLFEYYKVSFYSKCVHGFCFSTTLSLVDLIFAIKNEQSDTKRIDNVLSAATKKAEAAVEKAMAKKAEVVENKEDADDVPF